MKYHESMDFSFFLDRGYFVYDYQEDGDSLHIFIKSRPHSCRCPVCGQESGHLHATYERVLQDTPIHGKRTYLHANVYKYDCLNPGCTCKVFMEDLPYAKASQVRTDSLNQLILGVSMFLSNEGASRVLSLLGVQVSNDTIQRLYDRIRFVDDPDVEGIGVDDVATRKGHTYATAIYDLKDHHLIALLDGRDGVPLKEWLKGHKKVGMVARDRASAYAAAIREILPECVQVADRFHILQNLLGYLKDIFKREMPANVYIRDGVILDGAPKKVLRDAGVDVGMLDSLHYDQTPPRNPDGTERAYDDKRHDLDSGQYREQAEGRKKTAVDPSGPGVLGADRPEGGQTCVRGIRDCADDRKEIHPYAGGGHRAPGHAQGV